ncbi:oligosaccharide flippase family protein [Anaerofilum sp. BX8]|uniref:Oligosaccharide flippase family protein n=1 Tax=Anaerofilum hominis TaxID=2763016 RepID=A0A923L103_9FIRM|nr:oligosaccharide flippase family protein [Anaerofilum hominis]MBC5581182.1 oligosaccharide flippase family protein [Anaerofilum hominis]
MALNFKMGTTSKNIAIVFSNNVISLLRGVLVSLLIPRFLSVEGYADYKLFTLYASYMGLLHFGFVDGICVKCAGKSIKEIGEARIRLYTRLLMGLELICSVLLLCIICIPIFSAYKNILFFLAIDIFIHNMTSYFNSLFQISMQFKKYTAVGIAMNLFQILSVAFLFIAYQHNCATSTLYISLFVTCELFSLGLCFLLEPKAIFGKTEKVKNQKDEIIEIFFKGIPLLVSGIISTLVLNMDRQFVSVLFTKIDYAIYSFAYTIMSLLTTLISSVSIVLYPALKRSGAERMSANYNKLCDSVVVLVFAVLIGVLPLCRFVRWILPAYERSLSILVCVFPSIVMISLLQIVMVNYYKATEQTSQYFRISILALGLSFILNLLFYQAFHNMFAISIATVISCFLWFMVCNDSISKLLNIKSKNILWYVTYMLLAYYIAYFGLFSQTDIRGMTLYGVLFCIGTVFFVRIEKRKLN